MNKKIYYSFEAWAKRGRSEFLNSDVIELFSESLENLIKKIKLFNKVACFECWTSLKFYKWEVTLFKNGEFDKKHIIDACYFPKMIKPNKIEVWGETYEI